MAEFIPGIRLAEMFYQEAVRPALARDFPQVRHSAALVGSGSEVLGFDTEMSADHHWGPRVMLFLTPEQHAQHASDISERLRHELPYTFHGYPTSFSSPNPDDNNVQLLQTLTDGPVNHRVDVLTIPGFVKSALNFNVDEDIDAADWLSFPQQHLLTLTSGAVFHDEIGLQAARDRFAYYPPGVWRYMLACGWQRIGQEEHLMSRAGYVGDEIGSALIGARLVRDVMNLGFLMERRYAPYPKWFGTAFARLKCAAALAPHLRVAQLAESWPQREEHLCAAFEKLAGMHNALGITPPVPEKATSFHGRPFNVIHGGEIASRIIESIEDAQVQRIIDHIGRDRLIGSIDQISDNTDVLENPQGRLGFKRLYSG